MQALIRVEAEELADDLDRQHLAVGVDRRRATLTQPTFAAQVADKVVHEAKDGDDEGLQVHGRPSLWLIHREERLGPVSAPSASSYSKTCTSGKLAFSLTLHPLFFCLGQLPVLLDGPSAPPEGSGHP